ncbi:alkene reductase [Sphingomonas sp. BN140010]|uniref:Alkene reductase n=1 Tax=Sphingomonas arvum TaxID=2992113 RepID=A0ABT3JF39_9SPHN|nr:alkene reductase [Sphingomonas sp. BN140010]MCW3797693.1 alkene reductase [Sphingomonas sp. BN140010]
MTSLFDPIRIGDLDCPNRIFMAPLTRGRATREGVPTAIMGTYYAQRAAAGLIISEGTGVSREGLGWPFAPGLWTDEQVEGWKPVLEQVHQAGGRIVAQLWHMGRLVHPDFLDGAAPLSASATTAPMKAHTFDGKKPYEQARAATLDDIRRTVDDFASAARNALAAGFDGVQLHGANGYLIDQFLRDGTNRREDEYGGSIDNRVRLLRDVVEALVAEVGAGRTHVRLSPNGEVQGCDDSNPHELFTAAGRVLGELGIASLELREPGSQSSFLATEVEPVSPLIRPHFKGALILNSDYVHGTATERLAEGVADAITFGRPFLANPDLVERFRRDAELNQPNPRTFYSAGEEGYTDYPMLGEQQAA